MSLFRLLPALSAGITLMAGLSAHADDLYPSLYSIATVSAEMTCAADDTQTVLNAAGDVQMSLCKKDYQRCLYFGSCIVEKAGADRIVLSYNAYNESLQRQTFHVLKNSNCLYGIGSARDSSGKMATACVDPYHSVAADPTEYKMGDVIYVPALVGLQLPTGETHDGYFVVRDSSESLNGAGPGRFDFFTGVHLSNDPRNVFGLRGMDHYDNLYDFMVVTGERAQEVLKKRNFPGLPASAAGGLK